MGCARCRGRQRRTRACGFCDHDDHHGRPVRFGDRRRLRHWEVDGAQYSRCNCRDHVDVRLKFTVTESNCPYTCVKIRVRNVAGASTWCWGGTGTGAWLTKTATLSGGGFTYSAQRLNANPDTSTVNDGLYFPAFYTGGVRDNLDNNMGICNADGYVGINDGMHINPCSHSTYFEWQISYDCGTNWSSSYFWGDTTLVPPPDGCTPTYGTTTTTTTRPTRSSESSDTETSGDGEVGESTNGGDMTQSASGETASTDMAQGASGGTVRPPAAASVRRPTPRWSLSRASRSSQLGRPAKSRPSWLFRRAP